jgi:hypothetical protein
MQGRYPASPEKKYPAYLSGAADPAYPVLFFPQKAPSYHVILEGFGKGGV